MTAAAAGPTWARRSGTTDGPDKSPKTEPGSRHRTPKYARIPHCLTCLTKSRLRAVRCAFTLVSSGDAW